MQRESLQQEIAAIKAGMTENFNLMENFKGSPEHKYDDI